MPPPAPRAGGPSDASTDAVPVESEDRAGGASGRRAAPKKGTKGRRAPSGKEPKEERRSSGGKDGEKKKKKKRKVKPAADGRPSSTSSVGRKAGPSPSGGEAPDGDAAAFGTAKRPPSKRPTGATVENGGCGPTSALSPTGGKVRAGERIRFVRRAEADPSSAERPSSTRSATSVISLGATSSSSSSSSSAPPRRQRVVPPCLRNRAGNRGGDPDKDDPDGDGEPFSDDEPVLLIRRAGNSGPDADRRPPSGRRVAFRPAAAVAAASPPSPCKAKSKSKSKSKPTKKADKKKKERIGGKEEPPSSAAASGRSSPKVEGAPPGPRSPVASSLLPPDACLSPTAANASSSSSASIMILDSDDDEDESHPIVYEDPTTVDGHANDDDDDESTTWASLRNQAEMEDDEEAAVGRIRIGLPPLLRGDGPSSAVAGEDPVDEDGCDDRNLWGSDSEEESSDGWETDDGDDSSIELDDPDWADGALGGVPSSPSGTGGPKTAYHDSAMTASTVSMTSRGMGDSSHLHCSNVSSLSASLSRGPAALMEEETGGAAVAADNGRAGPRPPPFDENDDESQTDREVNGPGVRRRTNLVEPSSVLTPPLAPPDSALSARPDGKTDAFCVKARAKEHEDADGTVASAVGCLIDFTTIQVYEEVRRAPRLPIWWMESALHDTMPDCDARDVVRDRMAQRSREGGDGAGLRKTVAPRWGGTSPTGRLKARLRQLSQLKEDPTIGTDGRGGGSYQDVKRALLLKMKLLAEPVAEEKEMEAGAATPVAKGDGVDGELLLSDSWHSISSAPGAFESDEGSIEPTLTLEWKHPSCNCRSRRLYAESETYVASHPGTLFTFKRDGFHPVPECLLYIETDFGKGNDKEGSAMSRSFQEEGAKRLETSTIGRIAAVVASDSLNSGPPSLKKKASIALLRQNGCVSAGRMHRLIGKFSGQECDEGEWIHPLYREKIANQMRKNQRIQGSSTSCPRKQNIDALVKLFEPDMSSHHVEEDDEEGWVHPLYRSML